MEKADKSLHWADILVFAVTLVISMAIGLYFAISGEKQRTTKEFLMGNRNLRVAPVALSMFMTYVSAVLVLGTSAEMYQFGTQLLTQAIGSIVGYLISAFLIVPVLYPLKLVSTYQYHEMRFHSNALRKLLSGINVFQAMFITGLGIYSPATALEAATGLKVWVTVLCTGLVATIYTSIGGIKAVVWTDTFQSTIFFGGMISVFVMGAVKVGGLDKVWQLSEEGGRVIFFNTDIHYNARATLWNVCFGRIATSFAVYGVGQAMIQRYSSLPTLRAAKTSVLLNIPMMAFIYAVIGLIGLTAYAYYSLQGCDPLRAGFIQNSNQLTPYFVVDALGYEGFSGLFIAVLFSGALSTISSSMSNVSALVWKDFVEAHVTHLKEYQKALITKLIVVLFGVTAIAMALIVQYIPGHVLQISNSVIGSISGATAGALILGLFIPFGNWKGAIAGIVSALVLLSWMNIGQFLANPFRESLPTDVSNCSLPGNTTARPPQSNPEDVFPLYAVSFNWFGAIGTGTSAIVGIIVSLLTGPQDPRTVDKRLVIPLFDKICCCLPLSMRKVLWCGVPRDEEDEQITDDKVQPDPAADKSWEENMKMNAACKTVHKHPHNNGIYPVEKTTERDRKSQFDGDNLAFNAGIDTNVLSDIKTNHESLNARDSFTGTQL